MNKKLLIYIGLLMFFTLVLCDEDIGQIGKHPPLTPTSFESN